MADPWGEFADAKGDPWREFDDAPVARPAVPLRPTGAVHDGDTFGLNSGSNARLSGVDAFELAQVGRRRDGSLVPLGKDARGFLKGKLSPNSSAIDTGTRSYDRPVMMLENGGQDVGPSILRSGLGMATPQYLRNDPRLGTYMEAERFARQNRQGAFGTQFQAPWDYRRDPWAPAELSANGKGAATFWDEPTPFQGVRPEIAQGYIALAQDPKSTAADLMAYAKANGFTIDPKKAEQFIKARSQPGARVSDQVTYEELPPVLTDSGDGALGSALRGVADPINMLDEMGGVVDALGGTPGRESVWNSDRRFGDILWNNIDQNRDILRYDDAFHPYARFGGQFASGLIAPGASIEGVGLGAARTALRSGASRFAAEAAAKAAVRNRLMAAGAIEGGVAGFGAGEGSPVERLPSAAAGAGLGAAFGAGTGELLPYLNGGARKLMGRSRSRDAWSEFQDAAPEGPAKSQDLSTTERGALAGERRPPVTQVGGVTESTGLPLRTIDRIDIWSEFPDVPSGAVDDPILGRVRSMGARITPEEMAATARTVLPEDVTPLPSNAIESLDEAMRANPGPRLDVVAPNERDALPSYRLGPNMPVRRDPIDLVGWLRTKGGVRDHRGELTAMGIDNAARPIEFAKSEGFLGKLIDQRQGMGLDDAAQAAWEAGFFPDHVERPTVAEFLDALRETHRGGPGRVFHPDDFTTLDAYRTAQAQRGRVEKAVQEGSPLTENVGQRIGLDDLDANQPPVTAYEDLPAVGGRAGNIRLDGLESSEDIRRALISTEQRVGGFDAARRGRISHGETEALARELGMTADDLLKRRQGQALNAEQALAARAILAKSGDELVKLASKVKGGSDEDTAAFQRAWVRHVAIQEQVSGATAEAGRALSQFRMVASSKLPRGRVLRELIDNAGGNEKLAEVAEKILELQRVTDDPAKVNAFAMKAMKPKWSDKLVELWYNSLLSGPQTHAVNVLSNSMTAVLQIPEQAVAAGLGALRRGEDKVRLSEISARAAGLLQGTREGLKAFTRTMRAGQTFDPVTKVEAVQQEAISGLKGKIIRTPTRALSAEDELFKAIARRMELSGLAVRKARGEGLKGDALSRRVEDLTLNPTDEMLERALDYSRYVTFQRPLGPVGQSVSRITQDMPILKLVLPFVRTPTNIFKFAIERSPAAPILREWRKDFAAGGASRDLALARMAMGTGLGMLVTELAAQGQITGGGPADDDARDLLRADGWQPYSIRIGDRYYSYQRLDPLASTLGVAADLVETSDYMTDAEREKSAALVTAAILKNLSNKTWLSGLSDAIEAIEDPDRYSQAFLSRLAGSIAVPAIVAQTARTTDPVLREARSPIDRIKSRIPGMSKTLLPRRDIWGEEVRSEGGLGPDIMSPIWTSTRRNDPLNNELLTIGAGIGKSSKRIGKVTMLPEEYDAYQALAGRNTRQGLLGIINDPAWMTPTLDQKGDEVDRIKKAARKEAREGLFGAAGPGVFH
jgi:endonuclease YncB( thermonuclease family)